jgi:hypothetical protein
VERDGARFGQRSNMKRQPRWNGKYGIPRHDHGLSEAAMAHLTEEAEIVAALLLARCAPLAHAARYT